MAEEGATSMQIDEAERQEAVKDMMNEIYTRQYFDISASEFSDEIFNICIHKFLQMVPSYEKSLLAVATKAKSSEETAVIAKEIGLGLGKFVMDFYAHLEKNTDVLEKYLEGKILRVPLEKVLDSDKAQAHYKDLIKALKRESELDGQGNAVEFSEETTVELLTKKLNQERAVLLQKRRKKLKLKLELELANKNLERLLALESSLSSVQRDFNGDLKEFVLNNVTALASLPKLSKVSKQ